MIYTVSEANQWCLGDRKYDDNIAFRKFKHRLYHASLEAILKPLHAAMTTPVVLRCPHYRWVLSAHMGSSQI